jgi:hypothetical protein
VTYTARIITPTGNRRGMGRRPVKGEPYWTVTTEARNGGQIVVATEDAQGHSLTEASSAALAGHMNAVTALEATEFQWSAESAESWDPGQEPGRPLPGAAIRRGPA